MTDTPGSKGDQATMSKHAGRLELTWTDKDKSLLSTEDGKYDYQFVDSSDRRVSEVRLLHAIDRVDFDTPAERPSHLPVPTSQNLLITGDAMHALDALAKIPEYSDEYLGKVKLVYIDPPFNTGQAFDNYEDNIEHSVWLTMLRDRLRQIEPLLSQDGSVWVHLDDAELHRCRLVMDEELGIENFVASIVWEKADSPNNSARHLSVDQDVILVYAKSKPRWKANRLPRSAASDAFYSNPDNDPRGRWYPGDPFANKSYSLGLYEIDGPTGRSFRPPPGRFWRLSEEKFRQFEGEGRIWWGPDGNARPSIKRFLGEVSGLTPRTLWRHTEVGSNRTSKNEMRALFPDAASFATPKPERLIGRVIHIATNPGDIVLDCFGGSGTTAAVAQKMGRRWVTSELLPGTVETFTKPRLLKVVSGTDGGGVSTTSERVNEAGKLPEGMTPVQAQEFNFNLTRVLKALADEANSSALDKDTIRKLRGATKTREVTTIKWHGGGGFTHVEVGPSMFTEMSGIVLLAEWATQSSLSKAMCAQLEVRYQPDGIFSGKKGNVRYVIIDGLVVEQTVASILDQLPEDQIVEVWATQVDDAAVDILRKARRGSRLEAIPSSVLDSYRRKATAESPFRKTAAPVPQETV